MFLNADSGFDSRKLRDLLEEREIVANIKQNRRNGNKERYYFDAKLYKNRFKIDREFAWLDRFKG